MPFAIDLGDIVAFVALLLSAWSVKKTNDFNKRQTAFIETNERLNQLLIEKESSETEAQKRADLSANFIKVGKTDWRLKVFNRGAGTATNVRIEVLEGDDLFLSEDLKRKFPIPILEQHQAVELIAAVHMGSPSRAHVKLIWDDAMGQGHEKELTPVL